MNDKIGAQEKEQLVREVGLRDIFRVLAAHKRITIGLPLIVAALTASIAVLLPNIYTGRAVLLPPQQQQSAAAIALSQLGALTGVAGSGLGIKNPNDLYVGILKSRTIADAIVQRFDLRARYALETLVETRKKLAANTAILSGKDGLIILEVEDEDPIRAAEMANAYVDELSKITYNLALSEASQRRLFFEAQLAKAKEGLVKAELGLKETQEHTGMVAISEQAKATIEAAAVLRGQIAAKEVELASMRTFATDGNPDYRRRQQEVIGLRAQLAKLERNSARDSGDILVPTGSIPIVGLEYARKLRDLKYQETIFELMAKQFEVAKLDEARDAPIVQLVDRAIPPDQKSGPRRLAITVLALFLSFIAVSAYFIVKDIWLATTSWPTT